MPTERPELNIPDSAWKVEREFSFITRNEYDRFHEKCLVLRTTIVIAGLRMRLIAFPVYNNVIDIQEQRIAGSLRSAINLIDDDYDTGYKSFPLNTTMIEGREYILIALPYRREEKTVKCERCKEDSYYRSSVHDVCEMCLIKKKLIAGRVADDARVRKATERMTVYMLRVACETGDVILMDWTEAGAKRQLANYCIKKDEYFDDLSRDSDCSNDWIRAPDRELPNSPEGVDYIIDSYFKRKKTELLDDIRTIVMPLRLSAKDERTRELPTITVYMIRVIYPRSSYRDSVLLDWSEVGVKRQLADHCIGNDEDSSNENRHYDAIPFPDHGEVEQVIEFYFSETRDERASDIVAFQMPPLP